MGEEPAIHSRRHRTLQSRKIGYTRLCRPRAADADRRHGRHLPSRGDAGHAAIEQRWCATPARVLDPTTAGLTELQQRLVHRDGLVAARTQFRNQLHALLQQPSVIASVQTRLERLIATLDEEIATVEQEIAEALQQDELDLCADLIATWQNKAWPSVNLQ